MNESSRANVWKLTAIGVVVAVASALVTGLVVANRASAPTQDARVEAPSEYREFVDLKHAFGRELRRKLGQLGLALGDQLLRARRFDH